MKIISEPMEIERKSFEIITNTLGDKYIDPRYENIIKRVIHTSADFEYADNLVFSEDSLEVFNKFIKNKGTIVTDTKMAMAGINKSALSKLGIEIECFIGHDKVAQIAKDKNATRSSVAVEYAISTIKTPIIFVVGNAPTALIKLCQIMDEKIYTPTMIIGVPVGFVNVVESKEMVINRNVPYIVAKGRKGGSNVAAAICNALMYGVVERD